MTSPEFPVRTNESSADTAQDLLAKADTLKRSITRSYILLGNTLNSVSHTRAYSTAGFKSMQDYVLNGLGMTVHESKRIQAVANGVRRMGLPDTDVSKFTPQTLQKLIKLEDQQYASSAMALGESELVADIKKRGLGVGSKPRGPERTVFIATMRSDQAEIVKEAMERFKRIYNTTQEDNIIRGLFVEMTAQEFLNMPETKLADGSITESDITGGAV